MHLATSEIFFHKKGITSLPTIADIIADGHVWCGPGSKSMLVQGYGLVSLAYFAVGCAQLFAPQRLVSMTAQVSMLMTSEYIVRVLGLFSLVMSVFLNTVKARRRASIFYPKPLKN